MESCCPKPVSANCPDSGEVVRAQGSNMAYCGTSAASDSVTEIPPIAEECQAGDKLSIQLSYSKNPDTECCKTCKCFGDPVCISFENVREEFILCDGRTPDEFDPHHERCIIRKATCENQTDHEGNACKWWNPNTAVPTKNNAAGQEKAEERFSVSKYGSPCQYDPEVSDPSVLLLYEVVEEIGASAVQLFSLSVEQYERGYINKILLKTDKGSYSLEVEQCMNGKDWTVEDVFTEELKTDYFSSSHFGKEYLWKVVADSTGIELGVRCTGVFLNGKITQQYMNIEYLHESDIERPSSLSSSGFCADNEMPEKDLASTDYSDWLREEGQCTSWNENRSDIVLRDAVSAFADMPGVSLYGVEAALQTFCADHARPRYETIDQCVSSFFKAKDVSDVITAFCKAVTFESDAAPCEEALQMYAATGGVEYAFSEGRVQFVESFDTYCDLLALEKNDFFEDSAIDECKLSIELQYLGRKERDDGLEPLEWITVRTIPPEMSKCSGYTLMYTYGDSPDTDKLFEYPVRLYQVYSENDACGACDFISTVDATFTFESEV